MVAISDCDLYFKTNKKPNVLFEIFSKIIAYAENCQNYSPAI